MESSQVIDAMVRAQLPNASAAHKAVATRMARKFCHQQYAEKNQAPTRTMAALKAHVTRRTKK